MSINQLVTDARLCAFMARARRFYATAGITGDKQLQHCLDLTIRYCLNTFNSNLDKLPDHFFQAILSIAARDLPRFVTRRAAILPPSSPSSPSTTYWTEKVAIATGLEAWLDDSLQKWYLDLQHPLTDLLVQVSRKHVTAHIAASIAQGTPLDSQAIIDAIVAELTDKFPVLARFHRHLPNAVLGIIETDILGTPLSDAPPVPAYNPISAILKPTASLEPLEMRESPTITATTTSTTTTNIPNRG
ncbi:MAG: hypothetical protein ACFFCS_05160 [Candidatus Hodarchaeota archaeon]